MPSAHVIVLGLITRSPRTLAHAQYLAREGWSVAVSGHVAPDEDVSYLAPLQIHALPAPPKFTKYIFPSLLGLILKQNLSSRGIQATVLYDRPPEEFKQTSAEEAHVLFTRLSSQFSLFADPDGSLRRTRFTELTALPAKHGGARPQWRPNRPAFVVSSCSWTVDDDFSLCIDALDVYNREAAENEEAGLNSLPRLVVAVTGRGPLKSHYESMIQSRNWTHVQVIMPWLEWKDYSVFLGSADLGISLHRSSSGLDLPMKVVDLIGVEVPVLALTYPTLDELMPADAYGYQFTDAQQLACLMIKLLASTSDNGSPGIGTMSDKLRAFRANLKEHNLYTQRAYPYWKTIALPVFESHAC